MCKEIEIQIFDLTMLAGFEHLIIGFQVECLTIVLMGHYQGEKLENVSRDQNWGFVCWV